MRINDGAVLSSTAEIRDELNSLSRVEPGAAPFVSCYLDLRAGHKDCVRFVEEKAVSWRDGLPCAARAVFDESMQLVHAELSRPWHCDVHGLAIFVCDRRVSCIATAAVLSNRLNVYDIPDVVPLVDLLQRERSHWYIEAKARRITRAARKSVPDVVAGAAASRAMLHAGLVKTLLVVPDLIRTAGWHCATCDATRTLVSVPPRCPRCEDSMRTSYQPLTELVRMASRRGVEVLVSTMDDLRDLGGVACLLAEPAERHLMPAPTLLQPMDVAA